MRARRHPEVQSRGHGELGTAGQGTARHRNLQQGTRRQPGAQDGWHRGTLERGAEDGERLGSAGQGTPRSSGEGRRDTQETGKTPFVSRGALRSPGWLGRVSRPGQLPAGGPAAHGAGSGPGIPELAGSPAPFPGTPAQSPAAKPPVRPRGSVPGRDGDGLPLSRREKAAGRWGGQLGKACGSRRCILRECGRPRGAMAGRRGLERARGPNENRGTTGSLRLGRETRAVLAVSKPQPPGCPRGETGHPSPLPGVAKGEGFGILFPLSPRTSRRRLPPTSHPCSPAGSPWAAAPLLAAV